MSSREKKAAAGNFCWHTTTFTFLCLFLSLCVSVAVVTSFANYLRRVKTLSMRCMSDAPWLCHFPTFFHWKRNMIMIMKQICAVVYFLCLSGQLLIHPLLLHPPTPARITCKEEKKLSKTTKTGLTWKFRRYFFSSVYSDDYSGVVARRAFLDHYFH